MSYADTTVSSDDQAQIDDLNNQYEELEEHQKEIQAQIDAAKSEKDKYLARRISSMVRSTIPRRRSMCSPTRSPCWTI